MAFTKTILNMKKLFLITSLLLSSIVLTAQEKDDWYIDFDKAARVSMETGKPILADFTGSDWCGWCIRLKKEVFNTPTFKEWAKKNVVLLELDFPRRVPQTDKIKKQNKELQQFFGVRGYPTIHIFNVSIQNEKIQIESLGKSGYIAGGPNPWIANAEKILANKKNN